MWPEAFVVTLLVGVAWWLRRSGANSSERQLGSRIVDDALEAAINEQPVPPANAGGDTARLRASLARRWLVSTSGEKYVRAQLQQYLHRIMSSARHAFRRYSNKKNDDVDLRHLEEDQLCCVVMGRVDEALSSC